ncbi:glutamate acetyltransferase [Nostocales cyanobacterium LEGE 11386]|nr:glutamate acetyltransferase [Nostocales cyanobacterium LEGE 11386]
MHQRLLVSNYLSIKRLIYSYLLHSLSGHTLSEEYRCIKDKQFPLYKGRDNNQVLYISGVALRLSKSHNQTPMEIASGIAFHLLATDGDVFNVKIVPPGWIYLELTHPFLAAWLQRLAVRNVGENEEIGKWGDGALQDWGAIRKREIISQNPARLFAIQYAHARCCSLVLLAHREGLIKLREPLPEAGENAQWQKPNFPSSVSAFWRVTSTEQIPWLNCEDMLRLNHPAEGHLISELVQAVDHLESFDFSASVNWEKVGLDLTQAFESFWRICRIWGDIKTSSPELAQARLGLVMATQSVLRFLLVEKLGVFAPLEL